MILVSYTCVCKSKVVLCFTKYHAMKMYGQVKVELHVFLSSVLDGHEWSALLPGKEPWYSMNIRLGGPQVWTW